jgi:hypothetical protein
MIMPMFILMQHTVHHTTQPDADGTCSAKYLPDENNGTIVATLSKLNPGEHFEGVDRTV